MRTSSGFTVWLRLTTSLTKYSCIASVLPVKKKSPCLKPPNTASTRQVGILPLRKSYPPGNWPRQTSYKRPAHLRVTPAVRRLSPKEKNMPYCDICHSENCEHQDRSCPCGCGNSPRENCVYDTAQERHVKNMLNLKPDEQWVTNTLEMPCNTCGHSFSRHLTAGGFCKHCECVKFHAPNTASTGLAASGSQSENNSTAACR